ncbi:MAG: hypothetical protein Q4C98_06240 [Capnocytophaga sp.]|nr:hypothetical protein [Capnocytophaga sp.]
MAKSTRPKTGYDQLVSKVETMVAGLKNNAQEVQKRGADADFIAKLEKQREEVVALNNEQERLKSELKIKTEAVDVKLKEIEKQMSEAKKIVKLAIPQAGWKAFGIEDSK